METTKIRLRPAVQFIEYEFPLEVKQHFQMLEGGKSNVDGVIIKDKFHIFHSLHLHKEKIRQFQKQQPAMDMFVRPEKPDKEEFLKVGDKELYEKVYKHSLQQWKNWQPVFVGTKRGLSIPYNEIVSDFMEDGESMADYFDNIDGFIGFAQKYSLHWNPENETVKGLYYPDIN